MFRSDNANERERKRERRGSRRDVQVVEGGSQEEVQGQAPKVCSMQADAVHLGSGYKEQAGSNLFSIDGRRSPTEPFAHHCTAVDNLSVPLTPRRLHRLHNNVHCLCKLLDALTTEDSFTTLRYVELHAQISS